MTRCRSYILITGGAGFIGTNLAKALVEQGHRVLVFDNLSRGGVEQNLKWLLRHYSKKIEFIQGDVRDRPAVNDAVREADAVFHLAAQVAVTTSMVDPVYDFEVNAQGTLNVLEAIRKREDRPFLLYTSTNKVLGDLEDLEILSSAERYYPADLDIQKWGVGENRGIEFCSPYGCSKGAADQYVLDYARCFGIPATVLRMSCIYGPHQCGNEDQGWVAHFVKQVIAGLPITFYGDGKQVRDALHVSDLIEAFMLAWRHRDRVSKRAFTIGGGPEKTTSLIELVRMIKDITGKHPEIVKEAWRPSDQKYYVSDTRGFSRETGWKQEIGLYEGVNHLYRWLVEDKNSMSEDFESSALQSA